MQIAVYAKKKLVKRITGVLILDVACGIGNMLTNKGRPAARYSFVTTILRRILMSHCIERCHLCAAKDA